MMSAKDTSDVYNAISSFVGLALSIVGIVALLVLSGISGKWLHFVSFSVYGVGLVLMFLSSALLHLFLAIGKYSRGLGKFDHVSIYILIAGTFTPICLVVVGGLLGYISLGAVWFLALFFSIARISFFSGTNKKALVMASYLGMGWIAIILVKSIYERLGILALGIAAASGIIYTVGSVFFFAEKPKLFPPVFGSHELWHTLVILANAGMYLLMMLFVLPLE